MQARGSSRTGLGSTAVWVLFFLWNPKKKAFWRLLLNKLFEVPLTLIAFPFPYFHIQWKSIGAKIVRLHHLLCSTKILWSQKDSKTVWLTTILKYFFIDFHSIFLSTLWKSMGHEAIWYQQSSKYLIFLFCKKYYGGQWDTKTFGYQQSSKYFLLGSTKIQWKSMGPQNCLVPNIFKIPLVFQKNTMEIN